MPGRRVTALAADAWWRLRKTPPRNLPGKVARLGVRLARARARRLGLWRSHGELSDRAFLGSLQGRFRNTDAAVRYFRTRTSPRFFVDPAEAKRRANRLAVLHPHLAERTQRAARLALEHVVDLLGAGPVPLGPRLPWLKDWKSGYEWPRRFYEDIDYSMMGHPADVKMPWELSRCYHFVTLGRAYALDGNPRYASEFAAQLEDWLDHNPWPYTVNWGRAMEVAIRAVNWIWADAFFRDAPEFHDRARLRLLKALLQHGRYVMSNLEYSDNNGNHYLSNGVGLVFLGLMYPEFREADSWRRKGLEIVWREMERQVHPDGVDFEKGIGYQGLVAELWYSVVLLCDLNGVEVPPLVRERLGQMFEFMQAYTRPDGTFPQIGDNDDGRLAGLDDEPVGTHRRHLAVGGAMYHRPDFTASAGDSLETALWLCGPSVLSAQPVEPSVPSRAFPAGGFYVLRASDAVMVVDAGEVGMGGIGGHGHNDLTSFDLWAGGAPLVVDSGTYVYTADVDARQAMRGTAAHNLVRVDEQEIARLGQPPYLWLIRDDARPSVLRWLSDDERDDLVIEHDGYARLLEPVAIRRQVSFARAERAWLIRDDARGPGVHLLELFFHLGQPIAEQQDGAVRLRAPRADLWIVPLGPPPDLALQVEEGWVSRGYGLRERAPVLRYALRSRLPQTLITGLVLVSADTPLAAARSLLQDVFPAATTSAPDLA